MKNIFDTGEPNSVAIGDLVRNKVNGFEGVVTSKTVWLYATPHVMVQPNHLGEGGKLLKDYAFSEGMIEVGTAGFAPPTAPNEAELQRITLGATARDTLTGYTGVVIGLNLDFSGILGVVLAPTALDKDDLPHKHGIFESTRIEVIERAAMKQFGEAGERAQQDERERLPAA